MRLTTLEGVLWSCTSDLLWSLHLLKSICNLIRSVNNGELLSLIHYNIIVSVPMGIYYQSILICLVLSQFTYSNYALCYFYRNTCFFDLDLVEDSLYSLSLVSRFNTQLPFYQTKSPHRTKKRRHLFWTAVRRQKHFLLPFLSCGIPEAGGWWQRGGRISSFFSGPSDVKTHCVP